MKIAKVLKAGVLALSLILLPTLLHAGPKNDPYVKQSDTGKKSSPKRVIGTAPTGEPLYQGPKGGRYHYDSSTKQRVYHPRQTQQ